MEPTSDTYKRMEAKNEANIRTASEAMELAYEMGVDVDNEFPYEVSIGRLLLAERGLLQEKIMDGSIQEEDAQRMNLALDIANDNLISVVDQLIARRK